MAQRKDYIDLDATAVEKKTAEALKTIFPLNGLVNRPANRFPAFELPAGPFDPCGNWRLSYSVHMLRPDFVRRGTLRLSRLVKASGEIVLTVHVESTLTGQCREELRGEVYFNRDDLFTPCRWQYASRIVDSQGNALGMAGLSRSAVVKQDLVEFKDFKTVRRIPAPKPFTVNGCLFDVVQRRSIEAAKTDFALFDHFENYKPEQSLTFRKSVSVLLGGSEGLALDPNSEREGQRAEPGDKEHGIPVRLHAFDHIGIGEIPWVYWVDEKGLLLFAVSGIQAYVFESYTPLDGVEGNKAGEQ